MIGYMRMIFGYSFLFLNHRYYSFIFTSSQLCLLVINYLYDFVGLLQIVVYHGGQFFRGWG